MRRTPSDRRRCWDCGAEHVLPGVDNIQYVDSMVRAVGWRYLEARGRMICSSCVADRRARGSWGGIGSDDVSDQDLENLPF